jgi:hypothetical protein
MYTHKLVCKRCNKGFTKQTIGKKSVAKHCKSCVKKLGVEYNKNKTYVGIVLDNGTRRILPTGYVLIKHKNKWIPEHRFIMEKILNRPLKKGESVHHKDGIRDNNSPKNLELWLGAIRYGQRATDIHCPKCGSDYWSATKPS